MSYQTIYSLGSRCQNALILKKNNLRDFSGFFDFLNVEKVDTLIHILKNEFVEFLNIENIYTFDFNILTIDPESDDFLPKSIRSSNKFYQPNDYLNPHLAICPHYDLKNEKHREHFIRCVNRFRNLKNHKVLFNYTYNNWENELNEQNYDDVITTLQTTYHFDNFKVCFVCLNKSNTSSYALIRKTFFYDIWELNILENSYTGGLFNNSIDNINFMTIINNYELSVSRLTKEQLDKIK